MDKAIKMLKAFKERNGNFYYMGEEMNIDEVIAELELIKKRVIELELKDIK